MATKSMMTVEDFAEMQTAETEDFELVEGELIPLSSANPLHAKVRHNLDRRLGNFLDQRPLGAVLAEVDCKLAFETVRRPDLAIILGERVKLMDPRKIPIPFAPDIAVEVLSPSESVIDVHRKALEYLAAGSQEVWQLDHENGEIFIQTNSGIRLLRDAKDVLESPLLPGFSATVAELLAGF
jgi:Uma2 family endonuclease